MKGNRGGGWDGMGWDGMVEKVKEQSMYGSVRSVARGGRMGRVGAFWHLVEFIQIVRRDYRLKLMVLL